MIDLLRFRDSDICFNQIVMDNVDSNQSILEIGAGAHPVIKNRNNLCYSIVDPDKSELDKAPDDINKIHGTVQDMDRSNKYDLVISRMVLEHVEQPDSFHDAVYALLKEEGVAVHFYACSYSLPSIANRMLPEKVGALILNLIGNRKLNNNPKYKAYYRSCFTNYPSAENYYSDLNFNMRELKLFMGHNYFKKVAVFKQLEEIFSFLLYKSKMSMMASVGILCLERNK